MIRVLSAGLMTSVQDLGRPGFAHLGVSMAGAADAVALRLANRLVGNREGAPALEITLKGGRFAFDLDAAVSVVGADFACSIPMGRVVWVRSGDVVEIGGCRSGARCYLGVRGGLEAGRCFADWSGGGAAAFGSRGGVRLVSRFDPFDAWCGYW